MNKTEYTLKNGRKYRTTTSQDGLYLEAYHAECDLWVDSGFFPSQERVDKFLETASTFFPPPTHKKNWRKKPRVALACGSTYQPGNWKS